jgi:hypothetical protein
MHPIQSDADHVGHVGYVARVAIEYEWLHVDFDDHLRSFYFDACGFTPSNAGLIALSDVK